MYKIGILHNPTGDGEQFDELEDAEEAAIENSIDDGIWGVWNIESRELVSIAYAQELFSK